MFGFVFLFLLTSRVIAGPQGGLVQGGTATIQAAGALTTITQTSDRAIVHWQRFDSAATETIRFTQPGPQSLILNRVVGVDPSLLNGALEANGRVFLLNPNGIVFGPGSRVTVGSLVASTLGITDEDFQNNRFTFVQDPAFELAAVINRGAITAAPGGTIALLAPIVDNSGTVVAAAGRIVLRAGLSATLDGLTTRDGAGRDVRLPAGSLSPRLEEVVNTGSVATANRVERQPDGTILLRGAAGLMVAGSTDAARVEVEQALAPATAAGSPGGATSTGSSAGGEDALSAANRASLAAKEEVRAATRSEEETALVSREEVGRLTEQEEAAEKEAGRERIEEKPEGAEPEVPEHERAELEHKVEEGAEQDEEHRHEKKAAHHAR